MKMEEEKFCPRCQTMKSKIEFCKATNRKDGLMNYCKICERERKKEYRELNKEQIKQKKKEYYEANKDKVLSKVKEYQDNNEEKISLRRHKYYENNKEEIKEKTKIFRGIHEEYYREYNKKYQEEHKEELRIQKNKYHKKRKKEDINYKLRYVISGAINYYLHKQNKSKDFPSWTKLPYTPEHLKEHLESLWESWMSWENYGLASSITKTWQIDHITPQSKLLYDSLEHPNFLECWKLENLRPLESIANILKGDKFPEDLLEETLISIRKIMV